nr:MAG TPA: hypothetical protein [Caudoviricetes sp.]
MRSACVRRAFCVRFACVLKPTCLQLATKKRPGGDFPLPGFLLYKERSSRSDREPQEIGYRNPEVL